MNEQIRSIRVTRIRVIRAPLIESNGTRMTRIDTDFTVSVLQEAV
jgi:hypothetical protein